MHKLYELKEKLMGELEDYADNGKFSKDDVEAIKYTASAIDHICNIVERCEDDEYSNADGMTSYNYGGPYMGRRGEYSYRRGGRRGGSNQYGSYMYSRASEDIAMELRDIMKDAPNEHIKQEIQKLVTKVEHM